MGIERCNPWAERGATLGTLLQRVGARLLGLGELQLA